jgi:integrase
MKEKNLRNVGGKWTVDIEIRGKRLRRDFQTKAEAEIALAVLRNQRAMSRLGIEVPEVKTGDILFKDFAEKVLARQKHLRASTKQDTRHSLNVILRSEQFKGKRLNEIMTEDVATYHANRGAEKRPSSNAELGLIKQIFKRAVEWGELARNPASPVKHFRLPATKLRILTDDEAALLLQAASPALVPLVRVLLTTGMRPHEVFALRWEHDGWDTEKGLLTSIVDFGKKAIFIPGLLAKNHKDRLVPLSPELLQMFRELHKDATTDKVFPWVSVPKGFREAVTRAGLKNVTLYTLKHTAASRMIRAGVDIVTVSEILGHSDIKMTMIYCHSEGQSKREAIEKVSRIYFKSTPAVDAPAAAQPDHQTEWMVS